MELSLTFKKPNTSWRFTMESNPQNGEKSEGNEKWKEGLKAWELVNSSPKCWKCLKS